MAGKDRGYRDLVDQVSDFVAKRTGESQGALVLLNRANQPDFDENMEMIRLRQSRPTAFRRSMRRTWSVQGPARSRLPKCRPALGGACELHASAAATLFIEAEEGGELPATIFPTLMNAAWQAVELEAPSRSAANGSGRAAA